MGVQWYLFGLVAVPTLLQGSLFAAATPLDGQELQVRQSSNTCSLPKLQPVIKSFVSHFPRSAVNSFCSSVVPPNQRPKTTLRQTRTTHITETVTDTYTATKTICVTRIPKREANATPMPAPQLQVDSRGYAFGYPPELITKACQCVMPTSTRTVTVQETDYSLSLTAVTNTGTVTATVTKTLPTFRAKVDGAGVPANKTWLQSGYALNDRGEFVFNVLTAVEQRSLATVFSLTCEGFLLQTNTSSKGPDRLLADTLYSSGQVPVYFDPDRDVEDSEDGNSTPPLICRIDETVPTRKLLKCRAVTPQRNQWQYCQSYEEFFATGVLLTDTLGPKCFYFDAVVEAA